MSGPHAAGERPGQSFFETVRSQQLESVGGFIFRQGKWQTVSVMFTLSGPQTLPHGRICSCFPDTFPPFEFRSFYPNVMSVRILFFFFFMGTTTGTTKSDRCECPAARIAVDVDQLLEINTVDRLQ